MERLLRDSAVAASHGGPFVTASPRSYLGNGGHFLFEPLAPGGESAGVTR